VIYANIALWSEMRAGEERIPKDTMALIPGRASADRWIFTYFHHSQSWMSSCTSLGERNNAAVYFCLPEESPLPWHCRGSNWGKEVVREVINYISWDKTVRVQHRVHRSAARRRSRTRFFKINKNIIFNNEMWGHFVAVIKIVAMLRIQGMDLY